MFKKENLLELWEQADLGKTTLLNCISTIDRVTAGKIIVKGQDITKLKGNHLNRFRREELGFIFQDFNLLDTLTAYENIALALSIQKVSVKEIEKRVQAIAQALNITDVLDKYPYQMSGGQKQRVFITMILAQDSEIILLDEPTTYLDLAHQLDILCLLKDLATKRNKTIVYVIHDLNHAARFADNLVLVKDGEVVEEGTVDELFTQKTLKECFGLDVTLGCDTFTKKLMITGVKDA